MTICVFSVRFESASVTVSPDTKGLNMTGLGAGHEADGWIRLDPTSEGKPATAIDKNYKAEEAY